MRSTSTLPGNVVRIGCTTYADCVARYQYRLVSLQARQSRRLIRAASLEPRVGDCNDDGRRTVAVGCVAELERAPYLATRAVYGAVHYLAGRYRAVSALGGRARDPESDGFADLAARCV